MLRTVSGITLALALFAFAASPALADELIIEFDGNSEFSGSGAGAFDGKVTVTISDVVGGVSFKVEASGMTTGAVDSLYLNIDGIGSETFSDSIAAVVGPPAAPSTSLDIEGSGGPPPTGFQADGDTGRFDFLFDFDKLENGNEFNYVLSDADFDFSGFGAASFDADNAPSSKGGPWVAAIHVHDNLVLNGQGISGWYGATTVRDQDDVNPTPEPATIVLLGSALGLGALARRRRDDG